MRNEIKHKPELLAPAGTLECAITAYEAGADAVYVGLKRYNISTEAENLNIDDISKLSFYAKQHKKKFYVVINALIKESEVTKVAKQLSRLSDLQPDGIIVQDLGVIRMCQKILPDVELHASSQMAIHNSAGIEQAKELGLNKVILAQELSIDEIKTLVKKSPIKIELIAHGTLSSSLVGNSIWSSWVDEPEGNHGNEQQVCRRRFHGMENGEKKSGFFFSANDLYTLDLIPKLSKIGISSFKIEGRTKAADYVKNTVKAYRMLLDSMDKDFVKNLRKAKDILTTSLGRRWSHGFLTDEGLKSLIQYDNIGLPGQLCGNIVQSNEKGFAIEVTRRIQKGDRINIVSSKGEVVDTVKITKMSSNRKPTLTVRKGERVFITHNNIVPIDGTVFKVGSTMKDRTAELNALPKLQKAQKVDIEVGVYPNGIAVKLLSHPEQPTWNSDIPIEPAFNKCVDKQLLIESFSETGNDKYCLGTLTAKIKRELFLPASTLKKERRAFWEWATKQLADIDPKPESKIRLSEFIKEYKQFKPADTAGEKEAALVVPKGNLPKKKYTTIVKSVYECNKKTDEVSLPHFCREDKIGELERRIKEAYNLGIRRYRVTALYQIQLLKKYTDIVRVTSYPLPIANSVATQLLKDCGFSRVQAWLALNSTQYSDLIAKSQLPVEIYRFGRPFLYATRAKIQISGKISDDTRTEFNVERNNKIGITYVYPTDVLSVPKVKNGIDFFDLSNAWWNEKNTTMFNFIAENHICN